MKSIIIQLSNEIELKSLEEFTQQNSLKATVLTTQEINFIEMARQLKAKKLATLQIQQQLVELIDFNRTN